MKIIPAILAKDKKKFKKQYYHIESYFNYVKEAENKIFRKEYVNKNSKNIKILPILSGKINNLSLSYLDNFLKSDIYVVFGFVCIINIFK